MSDIFPKWTNRLPRNIIIGALLMGTAVIGGVTYYLCTPKCVRVGYQPIQPVAFPHSTSMLDPTLGLDCRYCHNAVEKNRGIPTSRPRPFV